MIANVESGITIGNEIPCPKFETFGLFPLVRVLRYVVGRHIDSSHTLILSFRNTGGVVSVFVSDGLFNVIKRGALPKDGTTVNGLSVIICYLSAYGY
mgnify:CR=1 FL=1